MRTLVTFFSLGAVIALGILGASASDVSRSLRHDHLLMVGRSASPPAGCSTDTTLCLTEGRFLVSAKWTKPDRSSGDAHAVAITGDSGYFWFLEPDNPELAVKALDGCSTNGHFWFFGAGLSNLEIDVDVFDTATGQTKTYSNPQGQAFQPIADTSAFASCPAAPERIGNPEEPSADAGIAPSRARPKDGEFGCVSGDTVLCLDGRFQVEATWTTASGRTGAAHAASLTPGAGYFWFFDPENVEMIVKTLNDCGIGRGNWFFGAGMTTVGVQATVTDTFTGEVHNYSSSPGSPFLPIQDTSAFAFCPTPTPTITPTFTATTSSTPTTTATAHTTTRPPTPSRTPTHAVHQVLVSLDRPGFSPSAITIRVGDTVEWVWAMNFPQAALSTTSGSCAPARPCGTSSCLHQTCTQTVGWDSGLHLPPHSFSHRFTTAGTYSYYSARILPCGGFACAGHVGGTITVVP